MTRAIGAIVLAASCARGARVPHARSASVELALYRDVAMVRQDVELHISAQGKAHAVVSVPPDVTPDDVIVIDRSGLVIDGIHDVTAPDTSGGHTLAIDASALEGGTFWLVVGYVTARVTWEASYTWTTDPARTRAKLSGELAIHDRAGVAWHAADVTVIDALRAANADGATNVPHRAVGRVDVVDDARVPLVRGGASRMRPVLVFDPVGEGVDEPATVPSPDPELGVHPTDAPLAQSYELERDAATTRGLPAGDARLVEHRADGTVAVLGTARLFDSESRARDSDSVAVGTVGDVRGRRERRELTVDDDDRRIVEEFELTFDNARSTPVPVVAREHMVRGVNWHIAYYSGAEATKEGAQQIALRTTLPAHGRAKIGYVVVYTWDQPR